MTVITETRYGGVYEGGSWAAFAVSEPASVPSEAFGGDEVAARWWDAPTVPVGLGDSPGEALGRLRFLVARDRKQDEGGYFQVGQTVQVARCAPSDWYSGDVGTVRSVEFRRSKPYVGGLRGQCIYAVDFEDSSDVRVPESYLRTPPTDSMD
jgi:hypothetical protein